MPCFKGLAVSIHADSTPLPEHAVQRLSRRNQINTYIAVPEPRIPKGSAKPEPSKFAISITLLTPGLPVPYSTPKATPDDPDPKPQIVGGLPTSGNERGRYSRSVDAYKPISGNSNETIAAYIYFDGRAKEEVATLLRPGEETWVNSRWVQLDNGGLAEREFLFREVGLERWLNGLDLDGKDAAAKIERRRQKFEKRRRRRRSSTGSGMESHREHRSSGHILRYGADETSPVEKISDSSEEDSEDEDEPPEATGQIKVAMFRVLASGEIKRGEYSPQFDANDDDESAEAAKSSNGGAVEEEVDHTTSFDKPKALDPKSISTQTVTGIDGPEKPYAVFTFLYRGRRKSSKLMSLLPDCETYKTAGQLQKMGVIESSKTAKTTPGSAKRRSAQIDMSSLKPLKPGGTVGFTAFRDTDQAKKRKGKGKKNSNGGIGEAMAEDSDEDEDADDEIVVKMEDVDDKDGKSKVNPEDAKFEDAIAGGVGRIKVRYSEIVSTALLLTPFNSSRGNIPPKP